MCWSSAWRTGGCEAGNAGQGPRSGVIFLPLSPAAKREGYNGRYCANARQMRRPPQDGGQRAPSASPRNGDAKGPWRVRASGNAGKSLSCDPRATAARLCTCRYRSRKGGVAQTRIECNAPAKETIRNRYRTSVEQRSALPLKGAALSTNNKPRTKGLPWWNLLANLTVMPLRQPMSKLILPNIQASSFGFSWACPS